MNPSTIGERSEAAVLAALACSGRSVFLPFGGHHRYDLAFEEENRLIKVQCKTGHESNGAIWFRTHNVTKGVPRDYRADVDYFGVYCDERREVYLVPVQDVPTRAAHLRIEPAKNNQEAKIRWAQPYLLKPLDPAAAVRTETSVTQLRLVT